MGFFFRVGKNTMLEFFLTKNKSIKDYYNIALYMTSELLPFDER